MGTVPSVTATNSQPMGIPLSTPPMTPMSSVGVTNSINGGILGKRDNDGLSESEQEEKKVKKRRVAPTPVIPEGTAS